MLKIGKINYLNLYPVYEYLKNCQFCEFIDGEPKQLNKKLRNGLIDISPSSTFEYLKFKKQYVPIGNFSVSSRDKVLSVIFISKKSIDKINEEDIIYLSPSSSSSNSLIKIIFFEFLNIKPFFKYSTKNQFENKNQILIGDNALYFFYDYYNKKKYYIYDLADLWYKFTKLPFVFALWIGNKVSLKNKKDLISIFEKLLKKAIRSYNIPSKYKNFTKEQIINYFQFINYEFSEIHQKSLNLYEKLLKKWKLI